MNFLQLEEDEKVQAYISVKEFKDDEYLIFSSKKGIVKKSSIMDYSRPRKKGIIAIKIDNGDEIVDVIKSNGQQDVLLATRQGLAIHFRESDIRCMGRNSRGVRGIRLKNDEDYVVSLVVCDKKDVEILSVSERGYCKKTKIDDYRLQNRSGSGIINIKTTKKTGLVISTKAVKKTDELMIITAESMMIRCSLGTVRCVGRNTQGVRGIKLKEKDKVVSIATFIDQDKEIEIVDSSNDQLL